MARPATETAEFKTTELAAALWEGDGVAGAEVGLGPGAGTGPVELPAGAVAIGGRTAVLLDPAAEVCLGAASVVVDFSAAMATEARARAAAM